MITIHQSTPESCLIAGSYLPYNEDSKPISLEKFKENLKYFNCFEKNLPKRDEQAKNLFKRVPKGLTLSEIVQLIFKKCDKRRIPLLLNAFLITYPSYALSPFEKLCQVMAEDDDHALNKALFDEQAKGLDEEKLNACYNLAYRLNHPCIYRLSQTPILPSDYSLNFLWVNLNPQDRIEDIAQNIFGDGLNLFENADCIKDPIILRNLEENEKTLESENLENWEKIKKTFTYRISKWADINPGAQINLWYDSALVTQKAHQRTFAMMKGISESRGVNLKLKDIRKLSNIDGEIGISLHPGTQIYYRVDLLKALIADHLIRPEKNAKYCVVSDIDVEPMSKEQLFDQRTLDYLSSKGYVFNRVGLLGTFENSFFIFNKENDTLIKAHYKTIIKKTAAKITLLRHRGYGRNPEYFIDSQFIFEQYIPFINRMKEKKDELAIPRKVVKCPKSQFNFGGFFQKSDYRAEMFRFMGDSNIPYTLYGRNPDTYEAKQIEALIKWKAEPLALRKQVS